MTSAKTAPLSIQGLFPAGITTSCCRIKEADDILNPVERAAIEHAVVKRQQEFIAGRKCARQALERLGIAAGPLRRLPDGSIAWPDGVMGTVSHSEIWCGAAVVRRTAAAGIGLDIETVARVKENLWRRILTQEERVWLEEQPAAETRQWVALIFSAKEALYKCIASLLERRIGFMDAVIIPDPHCSFFAVRLNEAVAAQLPRGLQLQGRFFFFDGAVFTGLVLA
jgi:phosphopantetheine--protein transferase-like protein